MQSPLYHTLPEEQGTAETSAWLSALTPLRLCKPGLVCSLQLLDVNLLVAKAQVIDRF